MDYKLHLMFCQNRNISCYQHYNIKRHINDYFYGPTIDLRSHLIYKHINKINGKIYIGQCVVYNNKTNEQSMLYRFRGHCNSAKQINKYAFHKAICEFGPENFKHEIIDQHIPSQKEADEAEIYWIELYDCIVPNGYNMIKGGRGTSGWKATDEQRRLNSEKNKGKKYINRKRPPKFTQQHLQNMSNGQKGKQKHAIKIAKYSLEGIFLNETFNSIQDAYKFANPTAICRVLDSRYKSAGGFMWCTIKNNHIDENILPYIFISSKAKKINQYDMNHNFIQTFASSAEASRITHVNSSSITQCCKGNKKYSHAGGYIWEYFV